LFVTATDADGDVSSHMVMVYVALADEHSDSVEYVLGVGETKRVPLAELIPADQRAHYEGGNFRLAGTLGAGAHLRRGQLVLRPRAGDEGTHEFVLRGSRAGAFLDTLEVDITVKVGSGPEIVVEEGDAALPPGQDLTVHAGSSLDLEVAAAWSVRGDAPAGGSVAPVITLSAARSLPEGVSLTTDDGLFYGGRRSRHEGRLLVSPPAGSRARTLHVQLQAERNDGVRVERSLRIHVLPTADQAPSLELTGGEAPPSREQIVSRIAVLRDGVAELGYAAGDPEGRVVVVEVGGRDPRLRVDVISGSGGLSNGLPLPGGGPGGGSPHAASGDPGAALGGRPQNDGGTAAVAAPHVDVRQGVLDIPHAAGEGALAGTLRFTWTGDLPDPVAPGAPRTPVAVAQVSIRAIDEAGLTTVRVVEVRAEPAVREPEPAPATTPPADLDAPRVEPQPIPSDTVELPRVGDQGGAVGALGRARD
jgi:hypothetical protein